MILNIVFISFALSISICNALYTRIWCLIVFVNWTKGKKNRQYLFIWFAIASKWYHHSDFPKNLFHIDKNKRTHNFCSIVFVCSFFSLASLLFLSFDRFSFRYASFVRIIIVSISHGEIEATVVWIESDNSYTFAHHILQCDYSQADCV